MLHKIQSRGSLFLCVVYDIREPGNSTFVKNKLFFQSKNDELRLTFDRLSRRRKKHTKTTIKSLRTITIFVKTPKFTKNHVGRSLIIPKY